MGPSSSGATYKQHEGWCVPQMDAAGALPAHILSIHVSSSALLVIVVPTLLNSPDALCFSFPRSSCRVYVQSGRNTIMKQRQTLQRMQTVADALGEHNGPHYYVWPHQHNLIALHQRARCSPRQRRQKQTHRGCVL